MKIVIQRVQQAKVEIAGKTEGEIGKGLLLFLGIGKDDTRELADKFLEKIRKLRIFEDAEGKTNLSLGDVDGELLVVSQFTLYADCRKGNRPSFTNSAPPDMAEELYEYFLSRCREMLGRVEHGQFGADMQVSLVNDGPFTIVLDEEMLCRK